LLSDSSLNSCIAYNSRLVLVLIEVNVVDYESTIFTNLFAAKAAFKNHGFLGSLVPKRMSWLMDGYFL